MPNQKLDTSTNNPSYTDPKAVLDITYQIQGCLANAMDRTKRIQEDLRQSKLRIKMLEEELEATKPKAGGILSRKQFEQYFLSARQRLPTDLEWTIFSTSFEFPLDSLNIQVYRWIEAIQPFIEHEILLRAKAEEEPSNPSKQPVETQEQYHAF